MPNAPRTPIRGIRIPDELWIAAQEMAASVGTDVSTYIRYDLERRVKAWRKRPDQNPPPSAK